MGISKGQKIETELEKTIQTLEENDDFSCEVKVSLHDIKKKVHASVNGNDSGWAASIIKVPVMISILNEIDRGNLSLEDKLKVNHKFTLEKGDRVSRMKDGSDIRVLNLLYHMIVESDNEATNILADRIGVDQVNQTMWDLGMKNSMLGHLLCPGVPRYTSDFNLDGSNITCPDDMVTAMKHIYDNSHSTLSEKVRGLADSIMSFTYPAYMSKGKFSSSNIKSKLGYISCPVDGEDMHDVGIIDDRLIVCIMLNKLKERKFTELRESDIEGDLNYGVSEFDSWMEKSPYNSETEFRDEVPIFLQGQIASSSNNYLSNNRPISPSSLVYSEIMKTIGRFY